VDQPRRQANCEQERAAATARGGTEDSRHDQES
jgi:hypothetical protein